MKTKKPTSIKSRYESSKYRSMATPNVACDADDLDTIARRNRRRLKAYLLKKASGELVTETFSLSNPNGPVVRGAYKLPSMISA